MMLNMTLYLRYLSEFVAGMSDRAKRNSRGSTKDFAWEQICSRSRGRRDATFALFGNHDRDKD